MKKQTQLLIIKTWCSCIIIAPILFAFCMGNTLSAHRNPFAETALVVGTTICLGLLYFSPALLLALIVIAGVAKPAMSAMRVRFISTICLLTPVSLELLFLYKNNLSLIYKGTGVMVVCYLIMFVVTPWVFRFEGSMD